MAMQETESKQKRVKGAPGTHVSGKLGTTRWEQMPRPRRDVSTTTLIKYLTCLEAVRGDLHHSLGVTWRPQKRMSINFQTKTIFYYKENKKLNRKGNIIVMAQL